jgi:hypothetical protein
MNRVQKKAYEKPVIRVIELASGEVLSNACNKQGGNQSNYNVSVPTCLIGSCFKLKS